VRASSVVSARLYILKQLVTLLLVRASVISLPQSKQAASKQQRALLQAAAADSSSEVVCLRWQSSALRVERKPALIGSLPSL